MTISNRIEAFQSIFGERVCGDFDIAIELIGDTLDLNSDEEVMLAGPEDPTLVNLNEFKENPQLFIEEEYSGVSGYKQHLIKLASLLGYKFIVRSSCDEHVDDELVLEEEHSDNSIDDLDQMLPLVSFYDESTNEAEVTDSVVSSVEDHSTLINSLNDAAQLESSLSSGSSLLDTPDDHDDDNLYPADELNPPDALSLSSVDDVSVLGVDEDGLSATEVMVEEYSDPHTDLLESLNSGHNESFSESIDEAVENNALGGVQNTEAKSVNPVESNSGMESRERTVNTDGAVTNTATETTSSRCKVDPKQIPDLFFPTVGGITQSTELSTQRTREIMQKNWWISRKRSIEHAKKVSRGNEGPVDALDGKRALDVWQDYMKECAQGHYGIAYIERGHQGLRLIQALLINMDVLYPDEYNKRFSA